VILFFYSRSDFSTDSAVLIKLKQFAAYVGSSASEMEQRNAQMLTDALEKVPSFSSSASSSYIPSI